MTNFSIRTLDLPTFARHTVGFDRLFDEMNRTFANTRTTGNYPPYNIVRADDTHYVVEVAVAGFAENEVDVEVKENGLFIKGERAKADAEVEYVHKGIGARDFELTFTMADNMEVRAATVKNGILAVAIEHVVPEEAKPKKIAITFAK